MPYTFRWPVLPAPGLGSRIIPRTWPRALTSGSVRARRRFSSPPSSWSPNAGTPPNNIAILGGGLTGLSTALHLNQLLPSANITIYEASDRVGGWAHTKQFMCVDARGDTGAATFPLTIEHGPRIIKIPPGTDRAFDYLALLKTLHLLASADALNIGVAMFDDYENARDHDLTKYIYYPDHIVALPSSGREMLTLASRLVLGMPGPAEPLFEGLHRDLFRLARAMLAGQGQGQFPDRNTDPYWDMSIGRFVETVCGPESSLMTMVSSMFAGIYGGDPHLLSFRSSNVAGTVIPAFLDWHDWARGQSGLSLSHLRDIPPLKKDILISEKDFSFRLRHSAMLHGDIRYCNLTGTNLTFSHGVEGFAHAIQNMLSRCPKITIKLNSPVESLSWDSAQGRVLVKAATEPAPEAYPKVISTLFSRDLARLARGQPGQGSISDTLLPSLEETEATTILAVNVVYGQEGLASNYPGFGYLISPTKVSLSNNPERALGVLFDTNINNSQRKVEKGYTKFTVLIGGHHWRRLPIEQLPNTEEEAKELACGVLSRHLGIPSDISPSIVRHKLCVNCIPQHTVGHRERMARAHEELMASFGGRLAVAGPSYTRAGVLGALRAGLEVAESVADPGKGEPNSAYALLGDTGLADFVGYETFASLPREEWRDETASLKKEKMLWWTTQPAARHRAVGELLSTPSTSEIARKLESRTPEENINMVEEFTRRHRDLNIRLRDEIARMTRNFDELIVSLAGSKGTTDDEIVSLAKKAKIALYQVELGMEMVRLKKEVEDGSTRLLAEEMGTEAAREKLKDAFEALSEAREETIRCTVEMEKAEALVSDRLEKVLGGLEKQGGAAAQRAKLVIATQQENKHEMVRILEGMGEKGRQLLRVINGDR